MMLNASFPQLAAEYIQEKCPNFFPKIGLMLGSGLGVLAEKIENKVTISYADLRGFPVSTVVGHAGQMVLGYLNGVPVACLQGRAHAYEGTLAEKLKTMIRTLKILGCEIYLATNAAGSLREQVGPGELVMVTDHINFQPGNPLVGPNEEEFGERFVSLDDAYDSALRAQFQKAAKQTKIPLHEGVYIATLGPVFETPAEIRAFKILGADLVGMSTVPEVIIARHCNMRVAVISAVTNLAAGMSSEKLSHAGTLHYAKIASDNLCKVVMAFMGTFVHAAT